MNIVYMDGKKEPYTLSSIVSECAGVQHHTITRTIRNNLERFEHFGKVGFKIQAMESGQQSKDYILNEQQATLVNIEVDEDVVLEKVTKRVSSELLQVFEKFQQLQSPKRLTGLIKRTELMEELDIVPATILKWENHGLKRYQPPLEGTRSVYYKIDDVLKFLTME